MRRRAALAALVAGTVACAGAEPPPRLPGMDGAARRAARWLVPRLVANVGPLGLDAAYPLLELYHAADPTLRDLARAPLRHVLRAVAPSPDVPAPHRTSDLLDAIDAHVEARRHGLASGLDVASVAPVVSRLATRLAGPLPSDLDDRYATLLDAYVVHKALVLEPRLRPATGTPSPLAGVLRQVDNLTLERPPAALTRPGVLLEQDAYLATHAVFALRDFGRRPLDPGELPRTRHWLRRLAASLCAGPATPARDLDLTAEVTDALREDPRAVRVRTPLLRWLLAQQRVDGAFRPGAAESSPYDRLHGTWAALAALVEPGARPHDAVSRSLSPRRLPATLW